MDTNCLKKLQRIDLMMLKDLAQYCDSYGIEYYLDGGTLLGAVRHKGFIPWDDDIDVSMTSYNYYRFLNAISKYPYPQQYFVQHISTDNRFCFNWIQIRLNNTFSGYQNEKTFSTHNGICIDIFELRELSDSLVGRIIQYKNAMIEKFLLNKWRYLENARSNTIKGFIYTIIPERVRIKSILSIQSKTKHHRCKNFYNSYYMPNMKKGIFKKEYYNERTDMLFEDNLFSVPVGYENVLEIMYGNWKNMPPEEERYGHKDVIINFGPYNNI